MTVNSISRLPDEVRDCSLRLQIGMLTAVTAIDLSDNSLATLPASFVLLTRSQLLHINVQRFRGGLVFKAHRLVYHSTQSNKDEEKVGPDTRTPQPSTLNAKPYTRQAGLTRRGAERAARPPGGLSPPIHSRGNP